ncbi:MAG: radical SAM protein [Deltaproteobacteria bacterium]|nr:radical SAM protein [Deltaproteobacteria bacterium]
MKITFINPPVKLGKTFAHYPLFSNLGMLQNAAVLERAGFKVKIFDSFFITKNIRYRPIEKDLFHLGAELNLLEKIIRKDNSKIYIIPITMFSDAEKLDETYIPDICNIIKKYHQDSILIASDCYICGMNYFAYDSTKFLRSVKTVDINLQGETEATLLNTILYIRDNGLDDLPNGTFRRRNKIIKKPDIKYYLTDLNLLPYPAFHLLDMEQYFRILGEASRLDLIHEYHKPERFLPLMTSRGCLFSCNFCTQQVLRLPYRYYSTDYLQKEIIYFKKKYRIERFFFLDNNINADIRRFDALTSFLSEMKISWDAVNGFRADMLRKNHILKIKKAGNKKITVSAESGDPSVLNNIINKNLQLKSIIDVAKWSYETRLQSQVHYIIGMPGEDIEKMNKTLEFAEMLYEKYNAWPLIQHAIPFRETKLYRHCKENNYFAVNPDKTPTHLLEQFPIIKTDRFSETDVLTIKNYFLNKFRFYETTSFLTINNSCNNACVHCEISDHLNKKNISSENIKQQIKTAKQKGHTNIIITGGEPTIDTNTLFLALKHIRKSGFANISLTTNGRMFQYRDFARDILQEGINQISISVNSVEPSRHDLITATTGSFNQTIKGIQNLLSMNFRNININIRITSLNQNTFGEIIKSLSSFGIANFYLRVAIPAGNIYNNPSLLPNLKLFADRLTGILERYQHLNIKISGLPFCMMQRQFINNMTFYPLIYMEKFRRLKVKIPKCLNCIHYISCLGFYRPEYNQYYRQETE